MGKFLDRNVCSISLLTLEIPRERERERLLFFIVSQ